VDLSPDEGERGRRAPRAQNRGLAYWADGRGEQRILYISPGYHLIALDATTGHRVPAFGRDGVVDLYQDFDQPPPKDGLIGASSPPLVVGDVVIVGAALQSGTAPPTKENVRAHLRGYDVRTGERLWIFHGIPSTGEFGNDTWENDSWAYTGNLGAWATMSADLELGYIYVPMEMPTGDYYGGHRLGNNLFSETLVCLDAKTGKRVWHFQFVHHGIWDYDIPAPPNLVDIVVNGRPIKAVAQITKQAFTYVFDRVTGQPVWPIEERPVAASDVPGERTSPTQPFPTKPAPFDRQGVAESDLIDFTPELRQEAMKIASQYRIGPLFTPPSLYDPNGTKGTLMMPASGGGGNWQGAAVDPETGMMYVSSLTTPSVIALINNSKLSNMNYVSGGGEGRPSAPGPRITGDGLGPQGLPLVAPPWGRITAIDLNTGDHVWMVPNGETPPSIANHPALKGLTIPKTGTPERAGLLVTKTLLFGGEGAGLFGTAGGLLGGGPMFRAYDKATGEIILEFTLPASQTGLPMTYLIDGRQFIVVAVGARNHPAELVALSLP
jgi:quinoprotein glucose dehydrogenase